MCRWRIQEQYIEVFNLLLRQAYFPIDISWPDIHIWQRIQCTYDKRGFNQLIPIKVKQHNYVRKQTTARFSLTLVEQLSKSNEIRFVNRLFSNNRVRFLLKQVTFQQTSSGNITSSRVANGFINVSKYSETFSFHINELLDIVSLVRLATMALSGLRL